MDDKKETFNYNYSASQQEEIRGIREKYAPPTQEEDKMERLRRLDRSATKLGTIVSLIAGVVGTLIFGVGMCCVLVWGDTMFFPGIFIGIVGILSIIAAYPLYDIMTKKQRAKLAPEILRLSDELLK